MNIKGRFVTLRAIREEDSRFLVDMFNDPNIEEKVVGWSFPLSLEQQVQWFRNSLNDKSNQRFIIELENGDVAGLATLTGIDWKNRQATHGIKLLNDEYRHKGIGTDVVMAIERYAFEELGLHRLNSSRFKDNTASERLYTKCGWIVEGTKRACVFKHGEWKDLVIMGVLESDYRRLIEETHYWEKQND